MGTKDTVSNNSGLADELPNSIYSPYTVILDDFKISKYEISSELFYEFLIDYGKEIFDYDSNNVYETLLEWNNKDYFGYPAVSNYYYALSFCKWFGRKNGKKYRLPTEAEWEYVATGGDGRRYPWGNTYQTIDDSINHIQRVLISKYNKDVSPFGVNNMYGNVAEWVLDYYQYDAYMRNKRNNPICIDGEQKSSDNYYYPPNYVVRGQNFYNYDLNIIGEYIDEFATIKRRFSYWHRSYALTDYYYTIGFRIVEEIKKTNFSTLYGNVTYHYEFYKMKETVNVYLSPDESDKILSVLQKDEIVASSFILNNKRKSWLRIQTFEHEEYIEGKKMGDNGVVGWVELNKCIRY